MYSHFFHVIKTDSDEGIKFKVGSIKLCAYLLTVIIVECVFMMIESSYPMKVTS
jgi:hypothetical protein